MRIKLLHENYMKINSIFDDFKTNKIQKEIKYYSNDTVLINNIEPFPIYMANMRKDTLINNYLKTFEIIEKVYINEDREKILDQRFWHSLFIQYFREYLISNYPQVLKDKKSFYNIILKKFNWENYIYKSILAVQYVTDNIKTNEEKMKYYLTIINNMDVYNYLIKHPVFRNDLFIIKILKIIQENNLSNLLKQKIAKKISSNEDERYGRRVIFELNKSYPVIMSPTLSYQELKTLFMEYLRLYL